MHGCFIGFFVGFLALVFVMKIAFWGIRHRMGGGCYGFRHRRHNPYHSEGMGRAAGEILKRRLGIDEDQEGMVDHALGDIRASLKDLGGEFKATYAPITEAFRGETLDDAAISAAFTRQDDAIAKARREILSAFKQIHAVLRPDQRTRAADWASKNPPRWV